MCLWKPCGRLPTTSTRSSPRCGAALGRAVPGGAQPHRRLRARHAARRRAAAASPSSPTAEAVAQPTDDHARRRLERDGLVERSADPADARAVLAHLTDDGRERLDAHARGARRAARGAPRGARPPTSATALAAALPVLDKLTEEETLN